MSFIEEISAVKTAEAVGQAQVSLQNKQSDQIKAVVGTIIKGVEETPRPSGNGVGQKLNITA